MKQKLIAAVVLLGAGFLAGFIPQHSKTSQAIAERDELNKALAASRTAEAISSFRNRAALVYVETMRNNFSVASEMASKDFSDLQEFANATANPALKESLNTLLRSRDSIIAGLAKADPAVIQQLQEMYLQLQNIRP